MGSNGASSGGGSNRYEPPKKKNPVIKFIEGGGIIGEAVRTVSKKNKEINLKRRKEFIKKQGLTSDDIRMDDDYLSSTEGLAELRKQDYKTNADTRNNRDGGNNNLNTVVPLTTVASTAPTTAEVSQATATDATATDATDTVLAEDILLRNKKTKKKGRSMTILTSSKGIKSDEELTLGKKSLLGS